MDTRAELFIRAMMEPHLELGFRPDLISGDMLGLALGDTDEDVRDAAMYMLDAHRAAIAPIAEATLAAAMPPMQDRLRTELFEDSMRIFAQQSGFSGSTPEALLERREGDPDPTENPSSWLPVAQQNPTERILVIHGTWAKGGWWLPGSAFIRYLDSVSGNAVYKQRDQFQWSGGNSRAARSTAAGFLIPWLNAHPHIDTIVAHSHGGNVVHLALRTLVEQASPRRLKNLILLGAPARLDYPPDLRAVDALHNMYSIADLIQIGGARLDNIPLVPSPERAEGRAVSDTRNSLNIMADGRPGHSDLHDAAIWQANRWDRYL